MRGLQRIGAESLRGGLALLIGLGFFSSLFQGLNKQHSIFGIIWLALGGFAEGGGSPSQVAGLHGEQSEIKRIVVLVGINIGGPAKIGLSSSGLALACARNG